MMADANYRDLPSNMQDSAEAEDKAILASVFYCGACGRELADGKCLNGCDAKNRSGVTMI